MLVTRNRPSRGSGRGAIRLRSAPTEIGQDPRKKILPSSATGSRVHLSTMVLVYLADYTKNAKRGSTYIDSFEAYLNFIVLNLRCY